jgi:mRNA interferase RelE/StbE
VHGEVVSLGNYRVFETQEYSRRLTKLAPVDRAFIERKTLSYVYPQIREEPHCGLNIKKLAGYAPETWRYRIGKFRLFYCIEETKKTVSILTVEFRKDAY